MKGIWKEREYIDMWSVNHALFGASLAAVAIALHIEVVTGALYAAVLFILWEFIEYVTKVGETTYNQMTDIVVAMLGFFAFFIEPTILVASVVIFLFFVLETGGYLSKIQEATTVREKSLNMLFMLSAWVYVVLFIKYFL